jgi:UDP-glucose 4-epimerase
MRVLITGGAGYIGSNTALKFLKNGHDVFILDNLSTGFSESLPNGAKFILGEVEDIDLISKLLSEHKIDIVIHFAAKLIVSESVKLPLEYYKTNVNGLLSVLLACKYAGVKQLVFSSSAAVYGEAEHIPIKEDHKTNPINPYGRSKLIAEQMLQDYANASDFRFVALRYFNVAGASEEIGQRSKVSTHLIKIASEVATKKRESIKVNGINYDTHDGTCVRDYVHVEDLAEAHYLAASYLKNNGQSTILNCGYGFGQSVLDVIKEMEFVSNSVFKKEFAEVRKGDPSKLVACNKKILSTLNWAPKRTSLREICKSAFEFEKTLEAK